MRKNKQNIFLNGILLLTLLSNAGCVGLAIGAAAGAGGVAYYLGGLEKNLDYNVAAVHKATLNAFRAKEIFVLADELNPHDARISAEFDDGKNISVKIDALTEKSSKIKIRVGAVGDEAQSTTLLSAIEAAL